MWALSHPDRLPMRPARGRSGPDVCLFVHPVESCREKGWIVTHVVCELVILGEKDWGPHCQAGIHEVDPVEIACRVRHREGRDPLAHPRGLIWLRDLEQKLSWLYSPIVIRDLRPAALGSCPGGSTSCFTSSAYGILSGSNEDFGIDFGHPATASDTLGDVELQEVHGVFFGIVSPFGPATIMH